MEGRRCSRVCESLERGSDMTFADVFLTNDKKLKQIKEIKVLVLKDYL